MLPAVIVVLMLISFTRGENPAIQVILTRKGLQYGKAKWGAIHSDVQFI